MPTGLIMKVNVTTDEYAADRTVSKKYGYPINIEKN